MHGLVKFAIAATVMSGTVYGGYKLFAAVKNEYERQVREVCDEINTCVKNITYLAEKDNLLHNTARDGLILMGREEVTQTNPDIKRLEKILGLLRDELTAMIQSK